ncbi:uncharacterized protein HMPREF1541_07670 [Cyphellophora europaea CBS 101466]|uniref:Uncharacterized protein n=1 Tax=Cyphellophora europaea (strain CBS 101466) TaxID=1220924 RepID=W2RNK3_CYPE1|nr:uncharacterized protein HMPREF1541_07670 [Cyphellophora europaea CBS 101466]ETN38047.1 hypothetical protein HMPREF1541_07670 [Cyphellophora europaea CBS 101466]
MLRSLTRVSLRQTTASTPLSLRLRALSTLPSNSHVYVFPDPNNPAQHLLTFLPTSPPNASLAIGTTTASPPNPSSVQENPRFLDLLHSTIAEHGHQDPQLRGEATALATSTGGIPLAQTQRRQQTGSAGASDQGGHGGGGRGGWIHVYDLRHPPDFGRIPDPEDIFGSLEVDADGTFTDGTGDYQQSGTYRVCTRDGVVQLSDFLRGKLIQRLKAEEARLGKS